jgi:hypothetical protein
LEGDAESTKKAVVSGSRWYVCGVAWGVFNLWCNKHIPNAMIEWPEFHAKPWLVRWLLSSVMSAARNTRYSCAWLISEAGFRTLGADRLDDFDFEDWRSIRVTKFYTALCVATLATEWHHNIHRVLKEILYVRLLVLGVSKPIGIVATFAFTAYWHGFYSGYYLFSMLEVIMSPFDECRLRRFSPLLEKIIGAKATRIVNIVFIHVFNHWMGAPWDLYWAERYWRFYKSMYFGPMILVIVLAAIGFVFGPKPPRNQEEEAKEQEESKKQD